MLRRHAFRWLDRRDEQGSLIVAIMVLMVLLVLSTTLVTEVIGNQRNVVSRQSSAASTEAANAGISDALFRLDQGSTYEGSGTEFYVDSALTSSQCGSDVQCVGTSLSGYAGGGTSSTAGAVSYVARQVNSTKWTIQAEATVNGTTTAVQETISRAASYPFALFGNHGLNFNGNAAQAFGLYSTSGTGLASSTDPDTNPADCPPANGAMGSCVGIGSNGTISCNGGLSSNVTSTYYTGGGGVSGSCGTPNANSTLYNLIVPSTPSNYFLCPNGGQLGSNQTVPAGQTIQGVNAPLPSGTYLCYNQALTINGNLTVSGCATPSLPNPCVTIDVILDSSTNSSWVNSGTPTVDITAGSYVNVSPSITSNPPPAGTTLPDATQLTIASNSTGTVGDSNGQGYYYGGVLNAPDASLVGDGCKSVYYGAAIVNTLTCNGGPHLSVYYDSLLSQVYGPWGTSGYTQINPRSFSIP